MTKNPKPKPTIRKLEAELKRARRDLVAINKIIFAAGAPLGGARYFKIREIAAKYENPRARK